MRPPINIRASGFLRRARRPSSPQVRGISVSFERDEPVLVHTKCAVGVIGAHVRDVVDDGGSVAMLKGLLAPCAGRGLLTLKRH